MPEGSMELMAGMLVVLLGKIVWDWLANRRQGTGPDGTYVTRELCDLRHTGLDRDIETIRNTMSINSHVLARIDKRLAVLDAVSHRLNEWDDQD